jgi:hypothetical protein
MIVGYGPQFTLSVGCRWLGCPAIGAEMNVIAVNLNRSSDRLVLEFLEEDIWAQEHRQD